MKETSILDLVKEHIVNRQKVGTNNAQFSENLHQDREYAIIKNAKVTSMEEMVVRFIVTFFASRAL